jgi:hypothetical protein
MNRFLVLLSMLWLAHFLASSLAPVVGAIRLGAGGAVRGGAVPVGAVFAYGLVIASVGWAEGAYSTRTLGFWIALGAGLGGVALAKWGWREALRPPTPAGLCRACGYPVGASERCPECGGVERTDGTEL